MEPESSIRKIVSKVARKAYALLLLLVITSTEAMVFKVKIELEELGIRVYTSGGSLEGVIKAFIPRRPIAY